MERQNRQTWIAATAVILTGVGTTWWTGRRMITREDVDDTEIETAIADVELRETLMRCVGAMEAAAGTRTFADRYKDFIALAADHISVFGRFRPALTQFLV